MPLLKDFRGQIKFARYKNRMLAFDFSHWHQPQLYLKKSKRHNRIESYDDNA